MGSYFVPSLAYRYLHKLAADPFPPNFSKPWFCITNFALFRVSRYIERPAGYLVKRNGIIIIYNAMC